MPLFTKSRSYRINHDPPYYKDRSFNQCVKLLVLCALIFMITTIIIICYLNQRNFETTPSTTTATHHRTDSGLFGNDALRGGGSIPIKISTTPKIKPTHKLTTAHPLITIDDSVEHDSRKYSKTEYKPKLHASIVVTEKGTTLSELEEHEDYVEGFSDEIIEYRDLIFRTRPTTEKYLDIRMRFDDESSDESTTVTSTKPKIIKKVVSSEVTEILSSTETTKPTYFTPIEISKRLDDSSFDEITTITTPLNVVSETTDSRIRVRVGNFSESTEEITSTTENDSEIEILKNSTDHKFEKLEKGISSSTVSDLIFSSSDGTAFSSIEPTTYHRVELVDSTTRDTENVTNLPIISKTTNSDVLDVSSTTSKIEHLDIFSSASTSLPLECPSPPPVCNTGECKKSASRILALIDHDQDPCEDFHSYVCGGGKLNHIKFPSDDNADEIINVDLNKLDNSKEYIKKYKKYFNSCMQYNRDFTKDTMSIILKNIHEEDLTMSDKKMKLTSFISDVILFSHYGSSTKTIPVFDVVMDVGPNGVYIPVITIPTFKSPLLESAGGDFYEKLCRAQTEAAATNETNVATIYEMYSLCLSNENTTTYESILIKSIKAFKLFDHLPEYNQSQEINKVSTSVIWDVIENIAAQTVHKKNLHSKNLNSTEYVNLSDLGIKFQAIDWNRLFQKLFGPVSYYFSTIKIENVEYLNQIFDFYNKHSYETIKSNVIAMIAHDMYIDYLEPTMSIMACDRKNYCLKVASKLMDDVASRIIIDHYTDEEIKQKEKIATQIFKENILTYISSIENSTWLSNDEKGKLISKLNKLNMIGHSTRLFKDDKFIDANYKDINMIDCFITNTLKLQTHKRQMMYKTNGKSNLDSAHLWTYLSSPIQTKPVVIERSNTIALPFRFLTKHTNPDKQKYELYSHLSYQIAYEIGKFFTPENSNKILSKTNDVWSNFVNISLSDPQISRMNNIYELEFDKKDVALTIDSRFSDDSAFRIAIESYKIFQTKFSTDLQLLWIDANIPKLFYLSFGQQFCKVERRHARLAIKIYESDILENYFRLNSMVMNSVGFSDAFECPVGSTMNPVLKTEQFPFMDVVDDLDYSHI